MSLVLKQAIKKKSLAKPLSVHLGQGMREAVLFILSAIAVLLLIALISYDAADPGWSHTAHKSEVQNFGGKLGAWFADIFLYLFGYLAYLAPIIVGFSGWLLFKGESESGKLDLTELSVRWTGFFITLISGCGLSVLHFSDGNLPMQAGGLLGQGVSHLLVNALSPIGATLLLLALFLAGFTLFSGLSWVNLSDKVGGWTLDSIKASVEWFRMQRERWRGKKLREKRQETFIVEQKKQRKRPKLRIEPKLKKVEISSRAVREKQIPLFKSPTDSSLPGVDLLEPPSEQKKGYSNESLQAISRHLELKLRDFKVEAEVESVHPGPVVTRFELTLAPGTKVSKITGLAKDLARALSVISVRVVEVIPGKSTIGIEIPNEEREMVSFAEIIASKTFDSASSPLTLGLGKDISGKAVVADVAKMPHLLVAGTTGSGKSVAVNAMLLSFLFKASPKQVRLILIDPKMLELSVYDGIPHLLTPVVTDMKDAANALRWCVAEMERRYKLMSAMGVRNMAGFNRKVQDAADKGEPIKDPLWKPNELVENDTAPDLVPLPFISIVVDEFADMMMVVGKKVEELIARLAQKARASGIHLILATQRPSVDVITGLIKANIPSRMAFQVSSKIDSRTILDQMGAEQLLGHGDMLYLPAGTSLPVRIHGAYVSDEEVHHVANFLRAQGEPNYLEEITQEAEPGDADIPGLDAGEESDPLYDQAIAVVTESRKASISYVQRRLKVGYNRAARMIEQMEAAGVVSQVQGNGTREVIAPPPPPE
jgi:S-DNA-T family DNA segregation ATPase FtsK/SpoIIIE